MSDRNPSFATNPAVAHLSHSFSRNPLLVGGSKSLGDGLGFRGIMVRFSTVVSIKKSTEALAVASKGLD
jgi:hypothetical protein